MAVLNMTELERGRERANDISFTMHGLCTSVVIQLFLAQYVDTEVYILIKRLTTLTK